MKIAKHIIAIAVALLLVTSMAFADFTAAPTVSGGVLDGTTITVGDEGFTFSVLATEKVRMSTMTVDITSLIDDKWTISPIDGLYCAVEGDGFGLDTRTDAQIQPKLNVNASGYDCEGKALVQFKATPSADSKIDGITFKVTPNVLTLSAKKPYKTAITYTLAKKADTPVVNKYNVTFTGYESNNMTDVEENTEITLPAAPAVGENEVFKGWNDGEKTYAAGAKYPVTKDVTFKAVIETVVPQPVKAETKVESEKVRDLTYDTDRTSHFFEGIYSVTPNNEKIATFGVNIKSKADTSKTKTFEKKGLTVEGGAKIVLRLALINDDVDILNDLAGDVFYTAE